MSNTPEIELEQGFPECPNCFAEIDTWAAEKRAIEKERERIIALLTERIDYIREVTKLMGEPDDESSWSVYPRASFLEVKQMIDVIKEEN